MYSDRNGMTKGDASGKLGLLSQVFGFKTRMLGDAPKHVGADLHVIVKCPSVGFSLVRMNQLNVGGTLAAARFGSPAKAE